jgi:hypothetical protein
MAGAVPFPKRIRAAGAICLLVLLLMGGCSSSKPAGPSGKPGEAPKEAVPDGILKIIGAAAPPNSPAQFLARIADGLGWEPQAAQNEPLRKAVERREFDPVVMPFLLSLFYRNGFSVLPRVGEGNQFGRDTIVRGVTGTSRLLVTSREPIKLIFLGAVENIQIVYPQDGQPPQIFTVSGTGVVAVRRSQLEQYLQ